MASCTFSSARIPPRALELPSQGLLNRFYSICREFSPVKRASKPIRKLLFTPIIAMTLLHQSVLHVWHVGTVVHKSHI